MINQSIRLNVLLASIMRKLAGLSPPERMIILSEKLSLIISTERCMYE